MKFDYFQMLIFSVQQERLVISKLMQGLVGVIAVKRINIFSPERTAGIGRDISAFCKWIENHKWVSFKLEGVVFDNIPISIDACISPMSLDWINPMSVNSSVVWKENLISLKNHVDYYRIASYPATFDATVVSDGSGDGILGSLMLILFGQIDYMTEATGVADVGARPAALLANKLVEEFNQPPGSITPRKFVAGHRFYFASGSLINNLTSIALNTASTKEWYCSKTLSCFDFDPPLRTAVIGS